MLTSRVGEKKEEVKCSGHAPCAFYTRVRSVLGFLTQPILSCVKNVALVELLHLLQGTAHGCGVVRAKLVTR